MGTYLGFDPGGNGRFGWAILSGEELPLRLVGRGIGDHAKAAFTAAMNTMDGDFDAVGIDAPLFWRTDGDRCVDQLVREAVVDHGCHSATVTAVNSLRGACLIQGMLVALMCESRYSSLLVTEAHPKALLWLLRKAKSGCPTTNVGLVDLPEYVIGAKVHGASDHERDAVLCAVTAFAMHSERTGWQNLYTREVEPITPLRAAPGYWMPLLRGAAAPPKVRVTMRQHQLNRLSSRT